MEQSNAGSGATASRAASATTTPQATASAGQATIARQPTTSSAIQSQQPSGQVSTTARASTSDQLNAMAAEMTALGNRLATSSQQTIQRLSGLATPGGTSRQSAASDQPYRNPSDYRRVQQLVLQHEEHPEDVAALIELADLLHRNYKLGEAEIYLQKALALEPLNQELLLDLGYLYLEKGELIKARSSFQEVIYLNPQSIKARLAQGEVSEREGNYQEAEAIYSTVEEQFGSVEGVYLRRTLNLAGQEDYGAAVTIAREGIAQYPDHAPLYYARGVAYAGLGLLDRANTDLYDAIALDNDLQEAYGALGELALENDNAATAIRVYLRLVNERPGDPASSLGLGRAYLMDLRLEDAVQELEMVRYLHPGSTEANQWLAQAYYLYSLDLKEEGRFTEALAAYNKAMSLPGDQSRGWVVTALVNAGKAARTQADYQRSISYLEQAIDNDPFRVDSYIGLGRTYKAMRDVSRAQTALRQALAIDPSNPTAQAELNQITGR